VKQPAPAVASTGAALGFRSELIFHEAAGLVTDLRASHGCRVIRTPDNPSFYWGNYLLFDPAPRAGDHARWSALFDRLIAQPQPASTHRTFGWLEDAPGEVAAFLADGYERNDAVVMQATALRPAPAIAAAVRTLATEDDWAQLTRLFVATRGGGLAEAAYRPFAAKRIAGWRALAARGQGAWFGAFATAADAVRLVSALGIYVERTAHAGERLARYQSVMTDAAWRRQGLARALLAHAAQHACERLGAQRLVIVAMAGEMPEQLYASVGFAPVGLQRGLERRASD
jgi:GNAT superfamily N-acetyltransferase